MTSEISQPMPQLSVTKKHSRTPSTFFSPFIRKRNLGGTAPWHPVMSVGRNTNLSVRNLWDHSHHCGKCYLGAERVLVGRRVRHAALVVLPVLD